MDVPAQIEADDEFAFSGHVEWPCSITEYHDDPALSSTRLKAYIGLGGGSNESDAAREGQAIHVLATQPELAHTIVSLPEEPAWLQAMRGKKGVVEARARWLAEWKAEYAPDGYTILEPWQIERAKLRAGALRRAEIAKGLTLAKAVERRDVFVERAHRFWIHGLAGKRRTDIEIEPATFDIKSTSCETIDEFRRDVFAMGYDLQAAWNLDSGEALFGARPRKFVFLAVREDAQVAWIRMPESQIEAGRLRYRSALRLAWVARERTPPTHWEFHDHVLDAPAPWDMQAIQTMARHAEEVQEWHRVTRQQ